MLLQVFAAVVAREKRKVTAERLTDLTSALLQARDKEVTSEGEPPRNVHIYFVDAVCRDWESVSVELSKNSRERRVRGGAAPTPVKV